MSHGQESNSDQARLSKMKKLLLVGSASVHVLNFHQLIHEFFDEVHIVSSEAIYGDITTHLVDFSIRNPLRIYTGINNIRKIILEFQPTVIHIHQANSVAWITLKAVGDLKIPTVLTAWGDDILIHPHRSCMLKRMVQYNLRKASVITSDSLFMTGEIHKLLEAEKKEVVVANFGIETGPAPETKEDMIYSNRLHKPMYRINQIIQAFSKFANSDRGCNWKLVIAGSGSETESLKQLVSRFELEEKVSFTGWLSYDENRNYYRRAKIFVSIPESDATSVSLLEAMEAGCLPVVSNLPANMEWILDGVNGSIVQQTDEDFLSGAVELDQSKASELNRELIRLRASKEISRQLFYAIYNKLSVLD